MPWLSLSRATWCIVGLVLVAGVLRNMLGIVGLTKLDDSQAYYLHGWPCTYLERELFVPREGMQYSGSSRWPVDGAVWRRIFWKGLLVDVLVLGVMVSCTAVMVEKWFRRRKLPRLSLRYLFVITGMMAILFDLRRRGIFEWEYLIYLPLAVGIGCVLFAGLSLLRSCWGVPSAAPVPRDASS